MKKINTFNYNAQDIINAGINCYIAQVYARVARYAFLMYVFGYDVKNLKIEIRKSAAALNVVIPNAQIQHDAAAADIACKSKKIIDCIKQGKAAKDTAESIIAALADICQKNKYSYKMLFEKPKKDDKNGGEKTRLEKIAESLSLDDIKQLRGLLKTRESYLKQLTREKRAADKAAAADIRDTIKSQKAAQRLRAAAAKKTAAINKREKQRAAEKQAAAEKRAAEKQAAADNKLIAAADNIGKRFNSAMDGAKKAQAAANSAKAAALAAFTQRAESKKARNAAKKAIKAAKTARAEYRAACEKLYKADDKRQALYKAQKRAA